MTLFVSMKEGVLVVRDELLSFDRTQVNWWYHDLENRVSSSNGKEGDELDRAMDDDAFEWVSKHYLPLLYLAPPEPSERGAGATPARAFAAGASFNRKADTAS